MESNYLLLQYKHLPTTDFICKCEDNIRIQVKYIKGSKKYPVNTKGIYGLTDEAVYLFEDISGCNCQRDDILNAIDWYKKYIDCPDMRIVNIQDWLFYSLQ